MCGRAGREKKEVVKGWRCDGFNITLNIIVVTPSP